MHISVNSGLLIIRSLPRPCMANYKLASRNYTSSFYEILSLKSQNAGLQEIKKAYRSMVLRYHPDVCPPAAREESTDRFLHLQIAYETLSDPVSRAMYDSQLALGDLRRDGGLEFPRAVWEEQLHGLKRRSRDRLRRRTMIMKNKQ